MVIFSKKSCFNLLVVVVLVILSLTTTQVSYKAEGKPNSFSKAISGEKTTVLRGQIGSRPPRCERRCSSCGHCEAIQVPTNPQVRASISDVAFARKGGDGNSNYKPLSWKCKCGNFIFNP